MGIGRWLARSLCDRTIKVKGIEIVEFSDKVALVIGYIKEFELNKNIVITDTNNTMLFCTDGYARMFLSDPSELLSLIQLKNIKDEYLKGIARKAATILKILFNPASPRDSLTSIGVFKNYQQNLQKACFFWHAQKLSNSIVKHTIEEFSLDRVAHILYLVNCLKYPKLAENAPKILGGGEHVNLNERDHELLLLFAFGQSYKEISYILSTAYVKEISQSALKSYVHNVLLPKMSCNYIEEAVLRYLVITSLRIPNHLLDILEGFLTVDVDGVLLQS